MEGETQEEPVKDLNELQNADWVRRITTSLHQATLIWLYDHLLATHMFCFVFWYQARFWVQVMRDLRDGVKLKKVQERQYNPLPTEYQLTPYEMLMDDIRSKRYKLRKVMVISLPCIHLSPVIFILSAPKYHSEKETCIM